MVFLLIQAGSSLAAIKSVFTHWQQMHLTENKLLAETQDQTDGVTPTPLSKTSSKGSACCPHPTRPRPPSLFFLLVL